MAPGAAVISGVPHGVAPGAIQEAAAHRPFRVLQHDIPGLFVYASKHAVAKQNELPRAVALDSAATHVIDALLALHAASCSASCSVSWTGLHAADEDSLSCRCT